MNLFERFRQAEETIAKTYGAFTLFGLFERDDVAGKYDVVVSAPWLPGGRQSFVDLAERVHSVMGNDNWWLQFGKFVILPDGDPFVKAVLNKMSEEPVEHGLKVLNDFVYEGEIIRNAIIVTAQKNPREAMKPQAVAA